MALGARMKETSLVQIGDMVLGQTHGGSLLVGIVTSFRPDSDTVMVMSDDLDACSRVWLLKDVERLLDHAKRAFELHIQ